MKNIDIKSLIIGALLTSTIFLGIAATSPTDKWDDGQEWVAGTTSNIEEAGAISTKKIGKTLFSVAKGWEPFGTTRTGGTLWRKRIK